MKSILPSYAEGPRILLRTCVLVLAASCANRSEEGRKDVVAAPAQETPHGDAEAMVDARALDDSADAAAGSEPPNPNLIDGCGPDNAAGLTSEQIKTLKAGGSSEGMRMLYPYDGTVFPRGLESPMFMWEGAPGSAVYVHLKSSTYEYAGCLLPTPPGRVQIDADAWAQAGLQTLGPAEPFTLEVTVLDQGVARGPMRQELTIAQAALTGSLYYSSYNAGNSDSAAVHGGAILRIKPGKKAEVFIGQNGCVGCHSVSADGTRIVTGGEAGGIFAVGPDTAPNPDPILGTDDGFVGLSPDGSVYIRTGELVETDTRTPIPNAGLPLGTMFSFSPDSLLVVFRGDTVAAGSRIGLVDYDPVARMATNERTVLGAPEYLNYPFVLPDNRAVLYARGISSTGDGGGIGIGVMDNSEPSDLEIVDIESGEPVVLAQAMGFRNEGDFHADHTYLPFGERDVHRVYYPVASPVAAGGYFWVFFDSMRHYGNFQRRRQLWGTALRISPDGRYLSDPSSPAFYVPGQDRQTANHRAFTALDPCRPNGDACTTSLDCCGGHCAVEGGSPLGSAGSCETFMAECAALDERCETAADCCEAADPENPYRCIAGYCAYVVPVL